MGVPQGSLTVVVTKAQFTLLKEHDFPLTERLLENAKEHGSGMELSGTSVELENLLGWVAGEANISRAHGRRRKTKMFDNIADQLEVALARYAR